MAQKYVDSFGTRKVLTVDGESYDIFRLDQLEKAGFKNISRLPVSLKVLLENLLRQEDNHHVNKADIEALANWNAKVKSENEIAFMPARVLMQDLTGVPAVVDLAAMRGACGSADFDPSLQRFIGGFTQAVLTAILRSAIYGCCWDCSTGA